MNQEYKMDLKVNKKYKDSLFKYIFSKEENILSLYNALNNSHYTDKDMIEVNEIDGFIYLGIKNDVSFIIDSTMNLYEHQSSVNKNMPLRGLFYFSELYDKIIVVDRDRLHNEDMIKIPTPQYIVFYNGERTQPEKHVVKLSSAFANTDVKGCLELEATVLNINYGYNNELMEKCKPLLDYSKFVKISREYLKSDQYPSKEKAMDEAVMYCIANDILADILLKHRAEVIRMALHEWTMEDHKKLVEEQNQEIKEYKEKLAEYEEKLAGQDEKIESYAEKLADRDEKIESYAKKLAEKDEELLTYKEELAETKEKLVAFEKERIEFDRRLQAIEEMSRKFDDTH